MNWGWFRWWPQHLALGLIQVVATALGLIQVVATASSKYTPWV